MKQVILFLFLFGFAHTGKSQCIFIYAAEKIKGAEIPIVRTEFEVTINDSLKKKVSSLNDGSLGRISLEKGTYRVKISSSEFTDGFQENVIVNESKSTDVVINLTRRGPGQTEEKKKTPK
ncbi:MAG: hypothetical protein K0S12_2370 [Bacteroidetes bacterium]|jgi:hypothetical protein|nr:hypothetical protein [Bacteroidota bacterium]